MTFREDNITFALSGAGLTAAHNGIDRPTLVDDTNPDGMPLRSYISAKQFLITNPGNPILPHIVATFEKQFDFLTDLVAQRLRIIFLLRQQEPPCLTSNADVLGLLALWIYPGNGSSNKNNAVAMGEGTIMGGISHPFLLARDRIVTEGTVLAPGMMIPPSISMRNIRIARLDILNILHRAAGYEQVRAGLSRITADYLDAPLPVGKLLHESPLPRMSYNHAETTNRAQDLFPAAIISDRGALQKQYEALVGNKIAPSVRNWFQAA